MEERKEVYFCISCIIKHPIKFIKINKDYLLSHHPSCEYYRDDYVEFRGNKLCIGCFFTIPTVILVFILDLSLGVWALISRYIYHIILILLLVEILYYFNLLGKRKIVKIFSKIGLGLLYALLLLYPLYLPVSSLAKGILFGLVYMLLNSLIGVIRVYRNERKCRNCPMYNDYPFCDGYRDLIQRNIKAGFVFTKRR